MPELEALDGEDWEGSLCDVIDENEFRHDNFSHLDNPMMGEDGFYHIEETALMKGGSDRSSNKSFTDSNDGELALSYRSSSNESS